MSLIISLPLQKLSFYAETKDWNHWDHQRACGGQVSLGLPAKRWV